ncbi:helicase C-terminal domain-containing protein [Ewingella americana]|uniref:ATP-dependent helicase C-terminal domain-containing protein n=1 Tax=Ewingella americana TaxID=41202 RepID=A0A502GG72_9GAMM|nr:helicase C-terminal domain-containing protein [Ewingella americana]TPG59996.1 hypothetical protein EAH77_15630 [Ewingella americana]
MSNNKTIGFRTPQQKSISWDMYNNILNYVFKADKVATLPISLMHAETEEAIKEVMDFMPMVYLLNAPTGFGKSAISLEPLRWLTSRALGSCPVGDRDFPEATKALVMEKFELSEEEFTDFLHSAGKVPNQWNTPEVIDSFMENYTPESGIIPVPFSDGAIAAIVRTRSQTQAFLREAERLKARAIAMPSKASLCTTGRVVSTDSEALDSITFSNGMSQDSIRINLNNVINTTQIEGPKDFYTQDPNVLRLVSRCTEQCAKCPMNLKHAHSNMNATEPVTGVKADNLNIQSSFGLPSIEDYVNDLAKFQMQTKDLEESEILIRTKYPHICPYPTVRDALPDFDFLILTYPYVFNPTIASHMSDYLNHVQHILVDEAHNIQTLFQSLSSNVLLGESYYNDVNKSLIDYESELDILKKKPASKQSELFKKSSALATVAKDVDDVLKRYMSEKGIELTEGNSTYFLHRALMDDNKTIDSLTADSIFKLKDHLDPVVYYFLCWFANVQTKYIEFWSNLSTRYHTENQIPGGMEINPADILNMLFSDFSGKFTNNVMWDKEGTQIPFPIYSHASQNKCAKYRPILGNVNTFVQYFKRLKTWYYSDLLNIMNESASIDTRRAAKVMRSMVESTYKKAENILKLVGVLVNNHPEDLANWRVYQQINNKDFEYVFLDSSIGLMTSEETKSFKNYYLNESVDHDYLNMVVQKYGVEGLEQHESALFVQECKDYLLKSNNPEDLDIEVSYDIFNKLRLHCPECPLIEMPMLRYEGKFPPYMWKLYYRYWDDTFEICPLTLGRLLSNAFSNFKTVGLLSGTFQATDYLTTFWGVNPYQFNVTETVGTKKVFTVKGLSSKFAEREASYPRFAATAKYVFENSCTKNLLVAAPSNQVMQQIIRQMEEIIDPNNIWPNSRILKGDLPADSKDTISLDVNDMLEAIKSSSEAGVKKIFVVTMGSRFTEGVEYVNPEGESMLDSILICGIPYPAPDIFLDDQQLYARDMLSLQDREAFELIQTHAAFQKVRQTIGRGIRSNKDSVNVYLADNRYDSPFWREHIPSDGMMVAPSPVVKQDAPLSAYDTMDFDDDVPF